MTETISECDEDDTETTNVDVDSPQDLITEIDTYTSLEVVTSPPRLDADIREQILRMGASTY